MGKRRVVRVEAVDKEDRAVDDEPPEEKSPRGRNPGGPRSMPRGGGWLEYRAARWEGQAPVANVNRGSERPQGNRLKARPWQATPAVRRRCRRPTPGCRQSTAMSSQRTDEAWQAGRVPGQEILHGHRRCDAARDLSCKRRFDRARIVTHTRARNSSGVSTAIPLSGGAAAPSSPSPSPMHTSRRSRMMSS